MTQACSPAEYIEQCRMAIDPVKAAHVFHVRERLRRWLEAGPNRECRITLRRLAGRDERGEIWWSVDLLDGDTTAAAALGADHDDAIAHAVEIARAA